MAKVCFISDFDQNGSGYSNISTNICQGLVELGHDVKAIGLMYLGQQHDFDFSIIPCRDFREVHALTINLKHAWNFDVCIVALDIPMQERVINSFGNSVDFPYIGIMPVEADPLSVSWAMLLMRMNKVFIISKFGTEEAKKVGIAAEHIDIGMNTNSWRMPSKEEKKRLRDAWGYTDDTFVVLTVADNQERKNLSHSMQAFANFLYGYDFPYQTSKQTNQEIIRELELKPVVDARYNLVTREHLDVGWKLSDLAQEFGILPYLTIIERGRPFRDLWALYAMSDVFLLLSKSEGLGLPIREAMSVGIPVVATDCTAISESLADDRGFLVEPDYIHRDPFGNGRRYWADVGKAKNHLGFIYENRNTDKVDAVVAKARIYMETKDHKTPVKQLDKAIREIVSADIL